MNIIITDKQLNQLIFEEKFENVNYDDHVKFIDAWKEKFKEYPEFRKLQRSGLKVGDILPSHPKSDITTKTYVDNYLKKDLSKIIAIRTADSGDPVEQEYGKKILPTLDGKYLLRSELEVLTYNTFFIHGVADEIEVDSRKLKLECAGKEPDFIWENRKIIIEIAGWKGDSYEQKLKAAEECFNSLGYKTYVIWDKNFNINRYAKFYKFLCELLGFTPKQEVINNPFKFLPIIKLTPEKKQIYIDDNIGNIPYSSNLYRTLSKYINQLHGETIAEYKLKRGLPFYKGSVGSTEIKKFKEENPTLSYPEIAKRLGVSKNTVGRAIRGDIQKKYYQTKE
jgi:hypothetical protein